MVSCGVGCRHSSDLALLWLWRRPKAAALIRPLAWELPYAMGVALKRQKDKKRKKRKRKRGSSHCGSAEINLTSIHEDTGLLPGLAQWVKDPVLR